MTTTQTTSTEITAAPAVPVVPAIGNTVADNATGALKAWAESMTHAMRLANGIVKTAFVPAHFKGNTADAAVAIMKGAALGLDPLAAMEAIYVVKGKPALYSRAMLAATLAQGHTVEVTEATPQSVTVVARRRGSMREQTFTWSMERAQQAGYTSNAKYKSNPQEMLTAKAIAEACRVVAADALMGLQYSAEEVILDNLGNQSPTRVVQGETSPDEIGA